jgi:hypothetical protein
MTSAALLAAFSIFAWAAPAPQENPMQWSGMQCPIDMPQDEVVTSKRKWKKLWQEKLGTKAPEADLRNFDAAVVFLGERMTGGYSVVFDEQVLVGPGYRVLRYTEKSPIGGFMTQVITRPWAIRLVPKGKKPLRLEYEPR